MAQSSLPPDLPDLREGVPLERIREGEPLLGTVEGEPVLLLRHEEGISALGARCTHWGGPLEEGLAREGVLRCPWHHACFSVRDGARLGPPALAPLPRWSVRVEDGRARVGEPLPPSERRGEGPPPSVPDSVVIVGAGAAGLAAARTLRTEGYEGPVTLVDPDPDAPYDRPNLSKDYLAGTALEEWLPLAPGDDLDARRIARRFEAVTAIDPEARSVALADGSRLSWGALLLATGARAARPRLEGMDLPHVHTLRSLVDCRRLIAAIEGARRVVVVGAGFLGMEAAAALRARGLEVSVVAPEAVPFERLLGADLGRVLQARQEESGVSFRLGRTVAAIEPEGVRLEDGSSLPADVVLVAVGARPETALAEACGVRTDDGVLVDASLRTSVDGIWAAGDIARFPDPVSHRLIRVEHWTVALRQGETAARSILGRPARQDAPPFFWTSVADLSLTFSGHAEQWDEILLEGDAAAGDAIARYLVDGRTRAVAALGRAQESLAWDIELERSWREGSAPTGPSAAAEGAR